MSKRVAFGAAAVAFCMILSFLESLIPIIPFLPGIRLGLSNAVVLLLILADRPGFALSINLCRILLCAFLFQGVFSLCYSLPAALCSFVVMYLLRKVRIFTAAGKSLLSAVAHNAAQVAMASLLFQNNGMWRYFPFLAAVGAAIGFLCGLLCNVFSKKYGNLLQNVVK